MPCLAVVQSRVAVAWTSRPWLQWVALYTIPITYCGISRLVALRDYLVMLDVKSNNHHHHHAKSSGLALGFLEDLIATSLLVLALLVAEVVGAEITHRTRLVDDRLITIWKRTGAILRFFYVFGFSLLLFAPFAADILLVRSRQMRFTTELVELYSREKDQTSNFEIEPCEVRLALTATVGTTLTALAFSTFSLSPLTFPA